MRFTFNDIKPIPKYIESLIKKKDKKNYNYYSGHTRFYSYLAKLKNELVQVYVAVKSKNKKWYCKQVAVHFMHENECMVKDIEFYYFTGYVVGWYEQGLTKSQKWFENGWDIAYDKYFNMNSLVVNKEYALKFNRYKYSAVDNYYGTNILKYLRIYEKFPIAEMLVKLELQNYATSKMLLNKLSKDKAFRKWIYNNRCEIQIKGYYVSTILNAYKDNKSLSQTQRFEENKKYFSRQDNFKRIKNFIDKSEYAKFFDYLKSNDIDLNSYNDYLSACEYLRLDLSLAKNKYPHNFKKWHDIRIDEYNTAKAMEDYKKRKMLYKKFEKVAKKYLFMQSDAENGFVIVIAKSPAELINEGEVLHHCVGRMNYDQKFVKEESLIFFVRNKECIDKPFVTLEYSLKTHKVLQCYGEYNSQPSDAVIDFIKKKWLPYANKKLKMMVA